ncbi:aminoacyl-tRNA hydrolase [Neobittarella massiliensis]|uniref:aminoacyl-tRNA hydrolase n=1 Tax=Neobittarella massiliensis (ex Bilen et al. 2018) TaxID=2041842 RepID=UPI00311AB4CA
MALFSRPQFDLCVVGLGNPGPKYQNTRHNTGFILMEKIADQLGVKIDRARFQGKCGSVQINGKKVLLLMPQTFMNLSGHSVLEACNYYQIPPEKVLVIFDDISLEIGKMRIRRKGSHGGHNGIRDISYCLDSEAFPRIKVGIGKKPDPRYDLADWVLSRFTESERRRIEELAEPCLDTVQLVLQDNIGEAMNRYNS